MGSLHFWLYIFFQWSFVVSILSLFFDLEALFEGVHLFMAYLAFAPPQPSPPASMEIDPFKVISFSSLTTSFEGSEYPPSGLRAMDIMENDFHTPELD